MDSDDERFIDEIEEDLRKGDHMFSYKWATSGPDLKLYYNKERQELARFVDFTRIPESLSVYRLPRFFQTVCGFHMGTLDLTGRHLRRYTSLMKRWQEFRDDLLAFPHVKDDDPASLAALEAVPPEQIRTFENRWRLGPRTPDVLTSLINAADQVAMLIKTRPVPRLQKLCLHDLPPELLHQIVDILDLNSARRLGSTSSLFRQIAVSYIYRNRVLLLKPLDHPALPESEEEKRAAAMTGIMAAKQRLMDQMQTIMDDSHLLEVIQSLHVGGMYQVEDLETAGIIGDCDARRHYYGHLVMALGIIFGEAVNTRTITIHNWDLSIDLIPTILSLPNLRTLDLLFCRIWPGEIRQVESNVLNVRLSIDSTEERRMWNFVTGMPHLRVLSILRGSDRDHPILPPAAFRLRTNPFKTVERLFVSRLPPGEIYELAAWIKSARTPDRKLRLTHFKIAADSFGLTEIQIMTLVSALFGAPLKYLSFDGIHYAKPDLLYVIGHAFPKLESLSLHYRQSMRQARSVQAWWPSPTWEYATVLTHFPNLKHFLWNQALNTSEVPTAVLKYMEDGWPEDAADGPDTDELECYSDWHAIVRLFAVNAKALESVTFTSGGMPMIQYDITRSRSGGEGGEEKVKVSGFEDYSYRKGATMAFKTTELCDPSPIYGTWPRVFTPALPDEEE